MISRVFLSKFLLLVVVVLTAREYARWMYLQPELVVMGLQERPFVYRALIPWLAQWLVILGMHPDVALTVLIILSAIGLVYGIKYLFDAFPT